MGAEQAEAVSEAPADVPGAGLSLAGLIDVLDRAEDVLPRRPARPRRSAVHRSRPPRPVADRWDPLRVSGSRPATATARADRLRSAPARAVPLRSVQPAPAPRAPTVHAAAAPPVRLAPWVPGEQATSVRTGLLRAALRRLVRRAALWGAGPDGAYLAWGAPAPDRVYRPGGTGRPAAPQTVDPPVVLRELPSTPTNRLAAPSPAAVPGPPAPRIERWTRPPARLPGAEAPVPTRARSPGGIRGSPGTAPAHGSPPWWPEPG